jgi:hypothetical protein
VYKFPSSENIILDEAGGDIEVVDFFVVRFSLGYGTVLMLWLSSILHPGTYDVVVAPKTLF